MCPAIMTLKPLKRQSQLQQMTNFVRYFLIFERNKEYFVRIVCLQNIMPYLLFLKKRQNFKLSSAANYRWLFKG